MSFLDTFGLFATLLAAAATAFAFDLATEKRGYLPPRFHWPGRRAAAAMILATIFWIGVFEPLRRFGQPLEIDLSQVGMLDLFLMHILLVAALVAWYLLGYGVGPGQEPLGRGLARQIGLRASNLPREMGIGALAGVAGWFLTLVVSAVLGLLMAQLLGEELLLTEPPEIIVWMAALPVAVRIALSVSAGVVEEAFFRGFLQPRLGIVASSLLFVLAHAGYQQLPMLLALTVLSFFLAFLVRWRQSIWPAVVAHTLFDAIQLLVIIPSAMEFLEGFGGEAVEGGLTALLALPVGLPLIW